MFFVQRKGNLAAWLAALRGRSLLPNCLDILKLSLALAFRQRCTRQNERAATIFRHDIGEIDRLALGKIRRRNNIQQTILAAEQNLRHACNFCLLTLFGYDKNLATLLGEDQFAARQKCNRPWCVKFRHCCHIERQFSGGFPASCIDAVRKGGLSRKGDHRCSQNERQA